MALLVLALTGAHAYTLNEQDHFYCDFSLGQGDYDAWTVVSDGNDDGRWDEFNIDNQSPLHKGGENADANDWLFSPKFNLSGGKNYVVKMKLWADCPCLVKTTIGKSTNPDDQIIVQDTESLDGHLYVTYKIPEGVSGDLYLGIDVLTKAGELGWLYVESVEVVEDKDGSIAFTLVDSGTKEPISGTTLNLQGTTYRENGIVTDENGQCTFEYLTPGTYTVHYAITGLVNTDPVTIEVGDRQNVEQTLEALLLPQVNVTGKVVDSKGQPMEGAKITFDGEVEDYSCTTDAEGMFTIENAFGNCEYTMQIDQWLKQPYEQKVTLTDDDANLGTITLADFFDKPASITADMTENGLFVSWMVPLGKKQYVYDSGTYVGLYTVAPREDAYQQFGVRVDEPMLLEEFNWVVAELKDGKVDLRVYPLTRDGSISGTPVFEKTDVSSISYDWTNLVWNSYKLDEPLQLPYGCIISVGHPNVPGNSIAIPLDYQNNGGPSYVNTNNGGWSHSDFCNFFIRGKGTSVSRNVVIEPAAAQRIASMKKVKSAGEPIKMQGLTFNVWRINGSDITEEAERTQIAANTGNAYVIDRDFEQLPQGMYRYGVQALNADGRVSDITYSAPIAHNLTTDVHIYLYANTALRLANGAHVTLESKAEGGNTYTSVIADEKLTFKGIDKGFYKLTIEKYGFQTISSEVDLSTESEYYTTLDFILNPLPPFALQAQQKEASNDVLLTWNEPEGIFEDFEDMEDFAVNPEGNNGWTYADVDQGITYGVAQCQGTPYPNMHSPMAFMAFNPTATTPDVSEYVRPYSGKKMLIDAACEDGRSNDDYLFSPELNFDAPFTLRFMAAARFYGIYGEEEFMVGYTTGEATPENVKWLTDNSVKVGGAWCRFTYSLPAEARHAVIRCVSKDRMFFMLDDIFIGREEADVFQMTSFNVMLDNESAGSSINHSFLLENLEEGKHIASVQTVYTMSDAGNTYSDPIEIVFEVKGVATGIDEVVETIYTYDRAAKTVTAGNAVKTIEVFDIQGRRVASDRIVNLSGCVTGAYIIKAIKTDGSVATEKIVL